MENLLKNKLKKGLTSKPMYLPTWYRYDNEGSRLNDDCMDNSKYYYFHRSEMKLLQGISQDIIQNIKTESILVDLGSGNGVKTKLFIDELLKHRPTVYYVPVDISKEYLKKTVQNMKGIYGEALNVQPIGTEYLEALNTIKNFQESKFIVWFGGFQNMSYANQVRYLKAIGSILNVDDKLLVTADITDKSHKIAIENAYLDPDGYAGKFHLHAIERLNNEMRADIDTSKFEIKDAFIANDGDDSCSYVQVWIEALEKCTFDIKELDFAITFQPGEKLFLHDGEGVSCKYTIKQIRSLCDQADLSIKACWTNKHVAAVLLYKK